MDHVMTGGGKDVDELDAVGDASVRVVIVLVVVITAGSSTMKSVGSQFLLSGPCPLCSLVEDDIAADVDASGHGVIDAIRLGDWLIPDEDHAAAAVIQLLQVQRGHLDVGDTPEHAEVMYPQHTPGPQLVRRSSSDGLG